MSESVMQIEDHRTRTAAVRRLKMRQHLLESAIRVFIEKGETRPVVDDFMVAADVSRGTFYNYFRTPAELFDALLMRLSDDINEVVDPLLLQMSNPAERLACGTRVYMEITSRNAAFASLMMQASPRNGGMGALVERHVTRDLETGRAQGLFDYRDLRAALDLIIGCTAQGMDSLLHGRAVLDTVMMTFEMALRGLGLAREEALRVCRMDLPEIKPSTASILAFLLSAASGAAN